MTSSRIKNISIEKQGDSLSGIISVQDQQNITPKISLEEPVVNNGWKGLLGMFKDFVTVGGDFV